jgi:hypothetical protein
MNDSLDVAKCEGNLLFLNIALALLSDVLISKHHSKHVSQGAAFRVQGTTTTPRLRSRAREEQKRLLLVL